MRTCRAIALIAGVALFTFATVNVRGQDASFNGQLVTLASQYTFHSDVTYRIDQNIPSKLDVIRRLGGSNAPLHPALIFFHAGGWTGGAKESSTFSFLPYMEKGFTIFNVEYRMAAADLAPGAVE